MGCFAFQYNSGIRLYRSLKVSSPREYMYNVIITDVGIGTRKEQPNPSSARGWAMDDDDDDDDEGDTYISTY